MKKKKHFVKAFAVVATMSAALPVTACSSNNQPATTSEIQGQTKVSSSPVASQETVSNSSEPVFHLVQYMTLSRHLIRHCPCKNRIVVYMSHGI